MGGTQSPRPAKRARRRIQALLSDTDEDAPSASHRPSTSASGRRSPSAVEESEELDTTVLYDETDTSEYGSALTSQYAHESADKRKRGRPKGSGARQRDNSSAESATFQHRKRLYVVPPTTSSGAAEQYRTDLIHAIQKHNEDGDEELLAEHLTVEDGWRTEAASTGNLPGTWRVVDRWREEWNRGVQVPMNPHHLPIFESVVLPQKAKASASTSFTHPGPFDQAFSGTRRRIVARYKLEPKHYIGIRGCHYTGPSTHQLIEKPEQLLYEGDPMDWLWMERYNERRLEEGRTAITLLMLLRAINEIEIDCYRTMHSILLTEVTTPLASPATEEDAACDVCRLKEWEEEDPIVFCDGCNIPVHMSCYGLLQLPEDEWVCQSCALNFGAVPPCCVLCPSKGGAMKCTRRRDQWAHISCALWIPECKFENIEERQPIADLECIPDERWHLKCDICDTREGVCLQCSVRNCRTAFHVTCALNSSQHMEMDESSGEVKFIAFCRHHSEPGARARDKHRQGEWKDATSKKRTARHARERHSSVTSAESIDTSVAPLASDEETARGDKNSRIHEMERVFYYFVDADRVVESLSDYPATETPADGWLSTVRDVIPYWRIRRAEKSGMSLLRNPDRYIHLYQGTELPPGCGAKPGVDSTPLLELPGTHAAAAKYNTTFTTGPMRFAMHSGGRILPSILGSAGLHSVELPSNSLFRRNQTVLSRSFGALDRGLNLLYLVQKREKKKHDQVLAELQILTTAMEAVTNTSVPLSQRAVDDLAAYIDAIIDDAPTEATSPSSRSAQQSRGLTHPVDSASHSAVKTTPKQRPQPGTR